MIARAFENLRLKILQEAAENGIVNLDSVLNTLMSQKREQVLKIHPYAITPPSNETGRWNTYYKDERGKRKCIRAQTKEALLDKLIPIYFTKAHIDKLTFSELYEEWIEHRASVTNSPNTIKRHRQRYAKYFESSALHGKKLNQIDEILLEKECNRIVKEFKLTYKEYSNARTILNGMYEHAIRRHYLTENPMENVKIHVKFRQVVRKTGKTETYNTEELADINAFLDRMYAETEDTSFLAVKLNFLLGLRVGELVALKWDDLEDTTQLHIIREEVRDQTTNKIEIVEHTKGNHDRFVVVIPKAYEILKKIPREGEYIFMREGARITSIRIATILRKFARYQGVRTKSSHKMRKTYASNLNAAGVPLDCIREMLGHSSLQTTLSYIYNPLTEAETYDLIASAL